MTSHWGFNEFMTFHIASLRWTAVVLHILFKFWGFSLNANFFSFFLKIENGVVDATLQSLLIITLISFPLLFIFQHANFSIHVLFRNHSGPVLAYNNDGFVMLLGFANEYTMKNSSFQTIFSGLQQSRNFARVHWLPSEVNRFLCCGRAQ